MLRPGGVLALELGWKSEAAVRAMVEASGFAELAVRPDMQGMPRVMRARR
jgi:release factor glutamine methyltransferase